MVVCFIYIKFCFRQKEKDSYNNEVTKIARPLPVEYLIIDFPAAFPKDPSYSFNDNSTHIKMKFPIENRILINEVQVILWFL
jgi:nuclear protein localization family protein 4